MRTVIDEARRRGVPDDVHLVPSTVHRPLAREGLRDRDAPPGRPLQVVLDGTPAVEATVLDAYANTAVRRVRPSSHIETDQPALEPPPSRIALRDLGKQNREND